MARFSGAIESQAAQATGAPAGTTFNGYFAAVVAGASANFKLRRLILGCRAPSVPTSQQVTIGLYRQSVRAVGTGLSNVAGIALDPRSQADPTSGIDFTTAAAAGTTGPTIGANPLHKFTFNTQSGMDVPAELLEEWICDQGTANGLALVNIGTNVLPASHLLTATFEWEA